MDRVTKSYIYERLQHDDEEFQASEQHPSIEAVQIIYYGTRERDIMRRHLCSVYSDRGSGDSLRYLAPSWNPTAEIPQEFLLDLAKCLFRTWVKEESFFEVQKAYFEARDECDAKRKRLLDVVDEHKELTTIHDETKSKLEAMTKAYNTLKVDRDDIKQTLDVKIRKINLQGALLKAQEKSTGNEDSNIREKDETIQNKDRIIRTKNKIIEGKDAFILKKNALIREKDMLIQEKDALIKEKNEHIRAMEKTIQGQRQTIQKGYLGFERAQHQIATYELAFEKLGDLISRNGD